MSSKVRQITGRVIRCALLDHRMIPLAEFFEAVRGCGRFHSIDLKVRKRGEIRISPHLADLGLC